MVEKKKGSIINTASALAFRVLAGRAPYSVAKAGVVNLTNHLAFEFGPSNVRVNCIAPGLIRTPAVELLLKNPEYLQKVEMDTPLRRIGNSDDVVGTVIFLSSYITGQVIFLDGGRHVL